MLNQFRFSLWRGQVAFALATLEAYYSRTKNEEKYQELIDYLFERRPNIFNDADRRLQRQDIGAVAAEKVCDLSARSHRLQFLASPSPLEHLGIAYTRYVI